MSPDQPSPRPGAGDAPVAMPPSLAIWRHMGGRDIHEQHRASTPLEALFDLTAVVAVAAAATRLHHSLLEHGIAHAGAEFAESFFAIWWPWMSYTWFASAYDTDDVPFRMATLVQMIGVLLIAAGIPQAHGAELAGALGFFLMRAALVAQWWRASLAHPEGRSTCRRYAVGITLVQVLWVGRVVLVPQEWLFPAFCALALLEMSVPVWAARAGDTPWHAHHVTERYGLFTIILLGECMVAAANAMSGVLAVQGLHLELAVVAIATVGLILGLWWAYFLVPFAQVLHQRRERGYLWGYGHAFVFAALVVLGGVLEVAADALKAHSSAAGDSASHGHVSSLYAISLCSATVAAFFLALWWLGGQTTRRAARSPLYVLPVLAVALLAVALVAAGVPLSWGLLLLATGPGFMLIWITRDRQRAPHRFAVR